MCILVVTLQIPKFHGLVDGEKTNDNREQHHKNVVATRLASQASLHKKRFSAKSRVFDVSRDDRVIHDASQQPVPSIMEL